MSNDSKPNGKSNIIKGLCTSAEEGTPPLVVGFFLDGPTVADRKIWHFENGSSDRDDNLIQTHRYENSGKYCVWVDIINEKNNVIESSKKITIRVVDKPNTITKFDQWQGVIYEGDSVGFSIPISLPGSPEIMWHWDDETPDTTRKQNPHHQYKVVKTCNGKVTVSGSGITKSKEFAVMVLPDSRKIMAGYIRVKSLKRPNESSEFAVGDELTFDDQFSGGVDPYEHTWKITNSKGYIVPIRGADPTLKKTFAKSDNYLVTFTIWDSNRLKLTLSKTVIIL